MGLIITLSIIGYILCWVGSALFIIWGSKKWGEYISFGSLFYDVDIDILSIACILWPIIIICFFITVLCEYFNYRLEKAWKAK